MFQCLCITCILGCLTQSYGIHDESPCTEGTMGSGKDASEREEFLGSRPILRISSIYDTPVVKEGGREKCRSDTDASIPSPFQFERLAERDGEKDRFEAVGAEPMRTGGASALLKEGISVSPSSVQRTLNRCRLTKKQSSWKRPHDYTERPEAAFPGALVEMDTIHLLSPKGEWVYVYTMIDLCSRFASAEVSGKMG